MFARFFGLADSSQMSSSSRTAATANDEEAGGGYLFSPQATFGLTCLGTRRWVGIKIGSNRDVLRWLRASCLYAGTSVFLILALRQSTVTSVIVWRQMAPMPTMIAEKLLSNAVYRGTCYSAFGLLCITIGVFVYSAGDYQFSWTGTIFAILSTILMVWEGLYKRRELTNANDPLVMSLQAMVLLNNAVGCALALLLVVVFELWTTVGYHLIVRTGPDEALVLMASIILSAMYHYMGLQLAKTVSATSLLTLTNASKIGIVLFGGLALGDTSTPTAWAGVILAILGNIVYMVSRLSVMKAQALKECTVKDEGVEHTQDLADRIVAPDEAPPPNILSHPASVVGKWLADNTPLGNSEAFKEAANELDTSAWAAAAKPVALPDTVGSRT